MRKPSAANARGSLIASRFNLACSAGHRAYSPRPSHWIGRGCSSPTRRNVDGLPDLRVLCKEPLRALSGRGPAEPDSLG